MAAPTRARGEACQQVTVPAATQGIHITAGSAMPVNRFIAVIEGGAMFLPVTSAPFYRAGTHRYNLVAHERLTTGTYDETFYWINPSMTVGESLLTLQVQAAAITAELPAPRM